ncbi:helix-turn-helix domain-containing protein [Streptomyces sp. NPDC096934]
MFADRLNMLFEDSPRFGHPVTQAEVADDLTAGGWRMSRPYLSQLRRGLRTSPSPDVVAVLADYFGVDHDYFFRPAGSESTDASAVIDRLEQGPLRRLLSCVDGLSESSAGLVLDMAERLRRAEKCPAITAGDGCHQKNLTSGRRRV